MNSIEVSVVSSDRQGVPEIRFFSGTRNQAKNVLQGKLNKVFLHFFAIFDDFSKLLWNIIKYGKK